MKQKVESINFRIDGELKKKLIEEAKLQNRNLSNLCETALGFGLEKIRHQREVLEADEWATKNPLRKAAR